MIVHGGIGDDNKVISKLAFLDLSKNQWVSYKINGCNLPELSNHSACLVMMASKANDINISIFKQSDSNNSINKEGVYIFGGIDKDNNFTNELYRIKLHKPILEVEKVKINGIPPSERSNCSLNYYEHLNIIILHGGYNENRNKFFNDTYIFDIVSSSWIKIKLVDEHQAKINERCSHSSVIIGDELIIFGGNNEIYLNTDMFIIKLDFEKYRIEDNSKPRPNPNYKPFPTLSE